MLCLCFVVLDVLKTGSVASSSVVLRCVVLCWFLLCSGSIDWMSGVIYCLVLFGVCVCTRSLKDRLNGKLIVLY